MVHEGKAARRSLACLLAAGLGLFSRAGAGPPLKPAPTGPSASLPPRAWTSVKSWAYQLQHLDLPTLEASPADLLVIDFSRDGSLAGALSASEVARLRSTGKLVVAYLSIGEAEPYRFYWRKGWRPGSPPWLRTANPDWPDNFPVEFWDPEWKAILFGSSEAYLDRILAAGFDGVYLDIVDGYEAFQKERPSAARDMIALVGELAAYARSRAGTDFGIFSQNALDLLEDKRYRQVLTGLGKEETYFFPGDEPNPADDRKWEEDQLSRLVSERKLVLTVDYCERPKNRAWVATRARKLGFVPYLATRELDRLHAQPTASP